MPLAQELKHLQKLASNALALWDLPTALTVHQINVSENVTYRIDGSNAFRAILRVHREGYHSRRAIESELAWIDALRDAETVAVPEIFRGRDGQQVQQVSSPGLSPRFAVLFEFIDAPAPDETGDLVPGFRELGEIAARTHLHSIAWHRPAGFQRLVWGIDQIFGHNPTWGDWREAPGVDAQNRGVLQNVEDRIRARLTAYGRGTDRYGLIHADMRLANLLVEPAGTRLIDFDDCGFGWFLYDFAAAVSFMEDDPRVPAWQEAWLSGYTAIRPLSDDDVNEVGTFVMLRRMALLAWIGSHIEAPEPQALAPGFAETTAQMGQKWLDQQSI